MEEQLKDLRLVSGINTYTILSEFLNNPCTHARLTCIDPSDNRERSGIGNVYIHVVVKPWQMLVVVYGATMCTSSVLGKKIRE